MFLYKHWTESHVYITPNLPIYMGISAFFYRDRGVPVIFL